MGNMKEIITRLKNDDDYYGEFGSQFLSNSNIDTLLNDPMSLGLKGEDRKELLMGSYFHTAILEPDKLENFPIADVGSRNAKDYKEIANENGGMVLLKKEVEMLKPLIKSFLENDYCSSIMFGNIEVEVPNVKEVFGNLWKGKADILDHDNKKIIDIKTTSDLSKFKNSAYRYNYDSAAWLYKELFGYDMVFIAIDKLTGNIGKFECSDSFYLSGEYKVQRASEVYDIIFKDKVVDRTQFVYEQTL